MSFTAGVDYICTIAEVVRLARNVVVADFSLPQVESWAQMEYSYIRTVTDKDDWDSNDREYGALKALNTELAAADVIRHYGRGPDTIALWQSMKQAAYDRLAEIVDHMDTDTGEADTEIVVTTRKSWNVNPDIAVPRGNLSIT